MTPNNKRLNRSRALRTMIDEVNRLILYREFPDKKIDEVASHIMAAVLDMADLADASARAQWAQKLVPVLLAHTDCLLPKTREIVWRAIAIGFRETKNDQLAGELARLLGEVREHNLMYKSDNPFAELKNGLNLQRFKKLVDASWPSDVPLRALPAVSAAFHGVVNQNQLLDIIRSLDPRQFSDFVPSHG